MKMTKKQKTYRYKLLRVCHALKNRHEYLCDDAERRDWLYSRYGTRSFANLTISELQEVAAYLRGAGRNGNNGITKRQMHTIRLMWVRHASDQRVSALMRFIGRTTGVDYLRPELMTKPHATQTITGLSRMFKPADR